MKSFMIYGAYGYTGALLARHAVAMGYKPVLSGRDPAQLELLAHQLDCQMRPATLDAQALDDALKGIDIVVHCAGPFVQTSKAMLDACLRNHVHYLDVTGEISVFEAIAQRDREARAAQVVLLPGIGFDVVPTDCLAMHLKQKLTTASELHLAFMGMGKISHGTLRTLLLGLGQGNWVRRHGQLRRRALGRDFRRVDFGERQKEHWVMAIPWGDISTAFHSTQIDNITTYMAIPQRLRNWLRLLPVFEPVASFAPIKRALLNWADRHPGGPDENMRNKGKSVVWGEVSDAQGHRARARLQCAEGYTLTVQAAMRAVEKLSTESITPGYHTPATAFGQDFILELDGSVREDL